MEGEQNLPVLRVLDGQDNVGGGVVDVGYLADCMALFVCYVESDQGFPGLESFFLPQFLQRIEHLGSLEGLGLLFGVDVLKFEDGGLAVLEPVFFPKVRDQDAVPVQEKVFGVTTVKCVVMEVEFNFSANAVAAADGADEEDFWCLQRSWLQ